MSYEKSVIEKMKQGETSIDNLQISTFEYLWQSNPFWGKSRDSLPRFLRNVLILKNFTDNELRLLTHYLHSRSFAAGEQVFLQGDPGVGFYFIHSGKVDIFVDDNKGDKTESDELRYVITLGKGDYFGELALLQNNSVRTATVTCTETTSLFGLFKPDMENMINERPVLAAKLLQSLSLIVTKRLFSLTSEIGHLKIKLAQYE